MNRKQTHGAVGGRDSMREKEFLMPIDAIPRSVVFCRSKKTTSVANDAATEAISTPDFLRDGLLFRPF